MPIASFQLYGAFKAAFEIVRTVEVVGDDERLYLIEVLHVFGNPKSTYSVRCQTREDVTVQPTFPQAHREFLRAPSSFEVWVLERELSSVDEATADEALARALTLLADLVRSRAAKNAEM